MRTYGRIKQQDGTLQWVVVETDPNGSNDMVYVTTLLQTLKLFLGESPFYANFGIPAKTSVLQQVAPDYYVARTQQQFAQYFANLVVSKVGGLVTPTYRVNITTHQGVKLNVSVPVPQ